VVLSLPFARRWLNPIVPIHGAREIRLSFRRPRAALWLFPTTSASITQTWSSVCVDVHRCGNVRRARIIPAGTPDESTFPKPERCSGHPYTSGTTADPKGVLHSHNTLLSVSDIAYHGRAMTRSS
jgi:cyclohexanecarboxylate-CoA ligase